MPHASEGKRCARGLDYSGWTLSRLPATRDKVLTACILQGVFWYVDSMASPYLAPLRVLNR